MERIKNKIKSNKLLKLFALCTLLFALCALLPSCDSASANPYKEMYRQQVMINDSLKADMDLLGERMDLIYNTSIWKIDSLKSIIGQQNLLIAQQDSVIQNNNANVDAILQSIQTGLENLSDQALQNLINIQKR